jgi:Sec-independent protein translocase protein TatA
MADPRAMPFPAFLNLGVQEIVILAVIAILVWGRRLPEVAGQAAGAVQRMRRSLDDLRRETGIDREIQNARRAVDEAVPRGVRTLDVRREARKLVEEATRPAPVDEAPAVPAPEPEQPSPPGATG